MSQNRVSVVLRLLSRMSKYHLINGAVHWVESQKRMVSPVQNSFLVTSAVLVGAKFRSAWEMYTRHRVLSSQ